MQIGKDRIHHNCPNDVHVCVVVITAYNIENYHDDMVNFVLVAILVTTIRETKSGMA